MFGFSQTSEYKILIKDYVDVMGLCSIIGHIINEKGEAYIEKLYVAISPKCDDMFGNEDHIKIFDKKMMKDTWSSWACCLGKDQISSFTLCAHTSLK